EVLIPFSWFYEINEFNGPAAGNTLEEAVMQALAEVVERHVSALIARGRLRRPTIDISSLKSDVARDLAAKFHRCGINLYPKDFTMGMGLPTIGVLAYDPATFPDQSEIVYTAGTASDPEKAFIRALTEVAQLGGDFNTRANFVASGLPKYTNLDQAGYITDPGPMVPISSLPDISSPNIRQEIEAEVAILAKAGFEVYVINITHPLIGVPVVYTIIPGAHFRERAKGSSIPFFAAKLLNQQLTGGELNAAMKRLAGLYSTAYYLKFHEGTAFIEENRPDLAAPLFREALSLNPSDEDRAAILTYLGLALKEMEEYQEAIAILEESALVDGERQDTFNLLGFCYFKTKQHLPAIRSFEQVLRIDPGSAIDYANIGTNYRELGRRDEAVQYYQTALELDPTMTWVWENLSKLT
ncbi:MAG: YcaO-like family protein, partial [Deltaproteobacteria bacterium]|nr:YcaO-like family protein [Deltaproteobacteria bacterium]